MAEFKTFRDVEASLWQSAVAHAISQAEPAAAAGTSQPAHPDHPLARAAERAGTLITHLKPLFASLTALPASLSDALVAAGGLEPSTLGAVAAAEAPRFATEAAFVEALRLKFGNLDPQWLEALRNYHRYLQNNRADVPYRKHTNLGDFVIEGKLPAQAKVALVADWGTGTSEAIALLQKLAAQEPDVLIHLGDIYYSGQQDEVDQRFKNPCRKLFAGKRTAIFTLAGNHDMYSGGLPYYR
jgi:3',5'-cyclic AMP phosphodiesterase CpdA